LNEAKKPKKRSREKIEMRKNRRGCRTAERVCGNMGSMGARSGGEAEADTSKAYLHRRQHEPF